MNVLLSSRNGGLLFIKQHSKLVFLVFINFNCCSAKKLTIDSVNARYMYSTGRFVHFDTFPAARTESLPVD
jgi:hypothetical protein